MGLCPRARPSVAGTEQKVMWWYIDFFLDRKEKKRVLFSYVRGERYVRRCSMIVCYSYAVRKLLSCVLFFI